MHINFFSYYEFQMGAVVPYHERPFGCPRRGDEALDGSIERRDCAVGGSIWEM